MKGITVLQTPQVQSMQAPESISASLKNKNYPSSIQFCPGCPCSAEAPPFCRSTGPKHASIRQYNSLTVNRNHPTSKDCCPCCPCGAKALPFCRCRWCKACKPRTYQQYGRCAPSAASRSWHASKILNARLPLTASQHAHLTTRCEPYCP